MEGWVKISRKLIEWEWADSPEMVSAWIHILMHANYEERRWHGMTVPVGSFITSLSEFSKIVGVTVQRMRTILNRLKSTNEITVETTNHYTMITVCKYGDYQSLQDDVNEDTNKQSNNPSTSSQQATNNQSTTTKEIKKERNNISSIPKGIDVSPSEDEDLPKMPAANVEDVTWVAMLYNQMCTSLPRCAKMTDTRRAHVRARLTEIRSLARSEHTTDIEILNRVFSTLQGNTFYHGDNARGWKADFDWITGNGTNWVKVYENKHERKPAQTQMAGTATSANREVDSIWGR